jgi:hypothetical protein
MRTQMNKLHRPPVFARKTCDPCSTPIHRHTSAHDASAPSAIIGHDIAFPRLTNPDAIVLNSNGVFIYRYVAATRSRRR